MTASAPSRRRGGLLRQHDFRLLWIGETTSRLGVNIVGVAMPLVAVVTLNASTFWVSALAAATWLPWLLVSLPAGAWIDRVRRRPIMIACNVGSMLLLASVPVAAWADVLTMAQLLIVSLLNGVAGVFFGIAYRVYLPAIVDKADLPEGNAKLQGSDSAAQVAGLGLGGLLADWFGAVSGVLVNASTFLFSAVCLAGIRQREPAPDLPARPDGMRAEIRDGVRYTARDPYLRVFTVYGAVTNLLLTGYQAILVVFLVRELAVADGLVGWLLASGSIGGMLGALCATRIARAFGTARGMVACKLVTAPFGLLIPLAGPGPRLLLLVVGYLTLAFGVVSANVIQSSFRQMYCPPALLGRITASISVANFGAIPLGALFGGGLATLVGLRSALWMLTAGLAVSTLILLVRPIRGQRDLPTQPPPSGPPEPVSRPR
jgi:MFS family permease